MQVDQMIFGDKKRPRLIAEVIEAMCEYIDEHVARGGKVNHVTRHMIGLFQGLPGSRQYRRILSTQAHDTGAKSKVLERAFAAVDFPKDIAA